VNTALEPTVILDEVRDLLLEIARKARAQEERWSVRIGGHTKRGWFKASRGVLFAEFLVRRHGQTLEGVGFSAATGVVELVTIFREGEWYAELRQPGNRLVVHGSPFLLAGSPIELRITLPSTLR